MEVELFAKKGAKKVLYSLAEKGKMKFTDLKELVGSPTTTSDRLQELTQVGVIKRNVQSDQYRTVMYSLTKKGTQIVELVKKIEATK